MTWSVIMYMFILGCTQLLSKKSVDDLSGAFFTFTADSPSTLEVPQGANTIVKNWALVQSGIGF